MIRCTSFLIPTRHTPRVQMKLNLGKQRDKDEQETDKVAADVVQQSTQGEAIQQRETLENEKELKTTPQNTTPKRKPEIEATDEAMGERVVTQVKAINQGKGANAGIHYPDQFRDLALGYKRYPKKYPQYKEFAEKWKEDYWNGYADPAYFERSKDTPMDWQLRPGVKASAGIKRWLTGGTIAECNTVLVAIEIDTLRAAIGDDKFDALYSELSGQAPGKQLLRITTKTEFTPLSGGIIDSTSAAKKGDPGTFGNRPVKKGEWYYFYNHPRYPLKHPAGLFQGENAICIDDTPGKQLWTGFGVSSVPEDQMLRVMAQAYS